MNGNVCLIKLKAAGGHFPATKVLRAITTALEGTDGFLEVMLMGDRKDPNIKVTFRTREEA